jgi:hypothetical protein
VRAAMVIHAAMRVNAMFFMTPLIPCVILALLDVCSDNVPQANSALLRHSPDISRRNSVAPARIPNTKSVYLGYCISDTCCTKALSRNSRTCRMNNKSSTAYAALSLSRLYIINQLVPIRAACAHPARASSALG